MLDLCNDRANDVEQNKLRTYKLFKQNIQTEKYLLTVKNQKIRKNICRFRISSHNLPIETGRHRRPDKIPSHLRTCNNCNLGRVGDEYHTIMECNVHSTERGIFFIKWLKYISNLKTLAIKTNLYI